jgi:hypothetical protein
MLNFFKKNAAYLGKKTCSKGRGIQKKCRQKPGGPFISLVNTAQKTLFGREHDFENIRSVKDFRTGFLLPTMKI